jgi:hypothetical protein
VSKQVTYRCPNGHVFTITYKQFDPDHCQECVAAGNTHPCTECELSGERTYTYDELRAKIVEFLQDVDASATDSLDAFLKMFSRDKTYTVRELRDTLALFQSLEGGEQ